MRNSLYPFFWQHGESHDVLEKYMEKIAESGMRGACIEARPHPEFVRDGWWKDMDCIVKKAKQLSMKLWILDDSHFPTGYANGKIKECYPEYRKIYLDMRRYDIQGPINRARIDLSLLKGRPWDKPDYSEHILGVYMGERCLPYEREDDAVEATSLCEITKQMDMDRRLLTVDIPDGAYSVFVVYETTKGGEEATQDYLNPLIKEATQVLINEVYEPHYAHYAAEFGTTIEGFFSDEPRFGNRKGTDAVIGKPDMVLPWRKGLEKELGIPPKLLPLLWANADGVEKNVRFAYMDRITQLYHENFTGVLAKWCREHGVWYLGHNIEDNGAHARLGYGTGHYFRGQKEMDFAGVDVIGGQIVPGMNYHHDAFSTGGSNGEFYHYALAKLAASAAHLDPGKEGRAMCEAFGAYGWNEGLKTMKWIADSLMARGINYLVPHAFNPKKFPDFDCPPHFYAHGHNPQFRYFSKLSGYMNRVMALFQGGNYPAKVGLLYPAELEWAGTYMPVEKPARVLTQNQIAFDIVTRDYLSDAGMEEGRFVIHETAFEVLVVPYGQNIPKDLYDLLGKMKENGIRIVFVDGTPDQVLQTADRMDQPLEKAVFDQPEIVSLLQLGKTLEQYRSLKTEKSVPELVQGEYEKDGVRYYLFFNEHIGKAIDTGVFLERQGIQYDAYRDVSAPIEICDGRAKLHLEPYETVIWIIKPEKGEKTDALFAFAGGGRWKQKEITGEWNVRFADSFSYPDFVKVVPLKEIGEIQGIPSWEKACGTLRFETKLTFMDEKTRVIDLGNVYETAEVFVNGQSAGVRLAKPYRFDISELSVCGENTLAVEVTNTLGTAVRDPLSHYLSIEPFGVEGPVILYEKQEEEK